MASYHTVIPEPDQMFVCPYDKVHVIRAKKMPYHLMKCRKNHPTKNFKVCHFNARHEVPEEEFRLHLTICPDKDSAERLLPKGNEEDWIKGNTDVPTYYPDVYVPDDAEDWDKECADTRIGVAPRDMAGIGYMKPLTGLKKSQKKAFTQNLLRGDDQANVDLIASLSCRPLDNPSQVNPLPAVPRQQEPVRLPTTFAQPALGRGRGMVRPGQQGIITPGTPSTLTASATPSSGVDLQKTMRRVKKKLAQIDHLVSRQSAGDTLNEEERVKIALKAKLTADLAHLQEQVANSSV